MKYDQIHKVKKVKLPDGRIGVVRGWEADIALSFRGGFQHIPRRGLKATVRLEDTTEVQVLISALEPVEEKG